MQGWEKAIYIICIPTTQCQHIGIKWENIGPALPALPTTQWSLLPKQWMNYLASITYTDSSSSGLWMEAE